MTIRHPQRRTRLGVPVARPARLATKLYSLGNASLSRVAGALLVLVVWCAAGASLRAQDTVVQTILHLFGGSGDGRQPRTGVVRDAAGNFYGTTYYGGASNYGTIYRVAADGTYTLLHSFGSTDAYPDTALVAGSDGNFYGTTTANGFPGTMYRITPTGEFTVLRTFNSIEFGGPSTGLVLGRDGNFYASALEGGYSSTVSVIYRVTPQGYYSIFHTFTAAEGGRPSAPLVLGRDGNFYGTTTSSGANGYGTVFSLDPSSGVVKVIHDFDSFTNPAVALTEGADGVFYGTTSYGQGFIFRITSAGDYAVLHRFSILEGGDHLVSSLTSAGDGTLYGVTSSTVYRLAPDGTYTPLLMLNSRQGQISNLTVGRNGELYATSVDTYIDNGVFFRLTLAPVPSSFFAAEVPIGNGFYALNYDHTHVNYDFGYYHYLEDRHYIYHLQYGFEYIIDAADGVNGVYLYDFKSQGFFYTSPTFPYPYLYDFNLESVVFHFEISESAGPPGTDPIEHRYFYVFRTGQFITK